MPPAMEIETDLSAEFQALNLRRGIKRISKYGRFEGNKQENVKRCVSLLEHTGSCRALSSCIEGECCNRTKQVLLHHYKCLKFTQEEECSICDQLIALCQLHSEQCKSHELGCTVPYCHNNKRQLWAKQEPKTPNNRNTDPTNEEYIEMVRKLRQTLRTSSSEEKKQNILQILKSNPKTTAKLLKDLYKIKKDKMGRGQVVPINNCRRQSVRQHCHQLG